MKYDIPWSKQYGKQSGIYGLFEFDTPVLTVCDFQLAHKILVKHYDQFDRLDFNWPSEMSKCICFLNRDIQRWKQVRSKTTILFNTARMRIMYDQVIDQCSANFCRHLSENIGPDKQFSIKSEISRLCLDIFLANAFSLDSRMGNYGDDNESDERQKYWSMMSVGLQLEGEVLWRELNVRMPGYVQRLANWWTGSNLDKSFDKLEKLISSYVVQRLVDNENNRQINVGNDDDDDDDNDHNNDNNNKNLDTVGLYLKLVDKNVSVSDPISVRFLSYYLILLFQGLLSGITEILSDMIIHLARYPSVQSKLFDELVDALETSGEQLVDDITTTTTTGSLNSRRKLSYDVLIHLPYMDAVIKELLRLNPHVLRLSRLFSGSPADSVASNLIPGLKLKPGDRLDIQLSAVHMSDELFPDPYQFNPDRFLDPVSLRRLNKLDPAGLMFFGLGPQMCVGTRLAMLVIKSSLAHMLYNFQLYIPHIDDRSRPEWCDQFDNIPEYFYEKKSY
ncbi:lithocholate 6-beta-hydroxylase-like [Oppia nitens]|uniref:lithocholate 6-beta-hydroxylase-like n=1 Tax=Oppia nitens TaxID=1686743 RepID=UPI0023DA1C42|nr:lithocholate 6-beta-hydroxylase-like [Oppia nitens]